uniref:Uncharacterized protein n=1 Tax=Siphoviridae sp. cteLh2 TaxID=2825590 RepID=A0A8S5U5W2_9CAUD|nr:MAG TPA: hypothetical protein [Siphoviridae sp. cteLh2]
MYSIFIRSNIICSYTPFYFPIKSLNLKLFNFS